MMIREKDTNSSLIIWVVIFSRCFVFCSVYSFNYTIENKIMVFFLRKFPNSQWIYSFMWLTVLYHSISFTLYGEKCPYTPEFFSWQLLLSFYVGWYLILRRITTTICHHHQRQLCWQIPDRSKQIEDSWFLIVLVFLHDILSQEEDLFLVVELVLVLSGCWLSQNFLKQFNPNPTPPKWQNGMKPGPGKYSDSDFEIDF